MTARPIQQTSEDEYGSTRALSHTGQKQEQCHSETVINSLYRISKTHDES